MTMVQQEVSIPGPHFQAEKPGDTFSFVYPEGGTKYTLTVQEYQAQILDTSQMMQDMEYPAHYHFMSSYGHTGIFRRQSGCGGLFRRRPSKTKISPEQSI